MPARTRARHRLVGAIVCAGLGMVVTACGSGGGALGGGGGGGVPATAAPATTTTPIEARPLGVAPAPWSLAAPIQREALVTDGTVIYLAGGLDPNSVSSTAVLRIDPATGKTTSAGTLAIAVHDTMGVWRNGAIVMPGGGTPPIRTDVQSVVPSGAAKVVGQLPGDRADLVAVLLGDTIYLLGGTDNSSRLIGSILSSTDGGATWQTVANLAQAVRYPAVGVWDGAIYLVGGVATTGGQDTTAIQRFDPKTNQTTVVGNLTRTLSHPTSVQFGPLVFLAGGFVDNKRTQQIQRLDLRTLAVTDTGQVLPAPLSDAAAVVLGNTGYLVGGEGSDGKATTGVTLLRLG